MKAGVTLRTDRLVLRHWTASAGDRAAFHRLSSDEQVMRYFPARLGPEEAEARMGAIAGRIAAEGFGWCAACLAATGDPVGLVGLAAIVIDVPFRPAVEIGWRFLPEHWGRGLATEAALALRDHGFRDLGLERIYALAVHTNDRSRAVMRRIGMIPVEGLDFDHPGVPPGRPDLRRHMVYRIDRPA